MVRSSDLLQSRFVSISIVMLVYASLSIVLFYEGDVSEVCGHFAVLLEGSTINFDDGRPLDWDRLLWGNFRHSQ